MRADCRSLRPLLVAVLVIGAFGGWGTAGALANRSRVPVGAAARLPSGARVAGALATSTRLQLVVALAPRDPAGLQSLATAVSTPGSSNFHRYLSVSQFAQRFGATDPEIAAVTSSLEGAGLSVGTPMANSLTLPVSGTATEVQRAFATPLAQIALPSGRMAYANTAAPTLPVNLAAEVQGVVGLNDLAAEQPQGLASPAVSGPRAQVSATPDVVTGGPQPCASATATATSLGGYTADTIASAYGFSSLYQGGDLGAGETIALYELEPFNPADVQAYQTCYGTNVPVTEVDVQGGPTPDGGDDTEAALDIEQVIGLAPHANILVYDAPSTGSGALAEYATIVSQDQAKVISSSWSLCEPQALSGGTALVSAENSLFEEAALQGQSLYIASGDAGSAACSQTAAGDTELSVGDPGSQPFATDVGGTTLYTTDPDGPFWAPGDTLDQGVWNDGTTLGPPAASASAGGISSYWAMPSYQSGAAASVGVINADSSSVPCGHPPYCREVPDVSADASPNTGYVVHVEGEWNVLGGTSAAAPLWAAFTGLVDASATCAGRSVGFVNPGLYQIAGYGYAANLSDVTLASPVTGLANDDGLQANGGLYPVGPGYDMATGLGTPIAPALATSLCEVFTVAVRKVPNQSGTVGTGTHLQASASDSGGVPLLYSASGLPAGLAINASTAMISGTPRTPGIAIVTVAATDQFHNSGSIQFSWTIAGPPRFSKETFSGVTSTRPKLSFTAAAGTDAPALKSASVALPHGVGFARKAKPLSRGISVKSSGRRVKFSVRVRHGLLTISFRRSQRTASVTIVRPSLRVGSELASRVRRRRIRKAAVGLRATDTSNQTTRVKVRLKV